MEEQKQRIKAAVTLVLDLAKAFERVSLPVTHFGFPRKILRVLLWVLRAPDARCSSKDVRQSRSRPFRLFCQGPSGVACLYALFLRDALSEVTKIYPSLKLAKKCDEKAERGRSGEKRSQVVRH